MMFKKGDVYIINGDAVRWVGVVISRGLGTGNIRAIEMAYNKQSGEFLSVDAHAYFNVERPGQRVLLQAAPKVEVKDEHANRT